MESEASPVVVKKNSSLLEELAKPGCGQRQLCPHGKLLYFTDADGSIRVHDLCEPNIKSVITSIPHYTSCLWINKSSSVSAGEFRETRESFLVAVTSLRDVHLYSVAHEPRAGEGEKEGALLLPFKLLSTMSKRQIKSTLSRAQLGSSLETLIPIGSHEGDIVLLANGHALLRIFSDHTLHQLSISAAFNVEPNMEEFQDDLIPHYVSRVSDVCVTWPLVFTLTEDVVYDLSDGKCIGVINPLEYCHMFCSNQPDTQLLLQNISSSSFQHISVTHDAMSLVVSTDTNYILLVNVSVYFLSFPNHYSKSFRQKPPKKSSHQIRSTQTLAQEEDTERLKYGGVTKRHAYMGVVHLGNYFGQYAVRKRYKELAKCLESFDPKTEKGLGLNDASKLYLKDEKPTNKVKELKWYNRQVLLNSNDADRTDQLHSCVVTSFKNPEKPTGHVSCPSSLIMNYPIHCVLPPPDHVTAGSTLFHLAYNDGIVMAYYSESERGHLRDDMGVSPAAVQERVSSTSYIAVYRVTQQHRTIARLPTNSWLILPCNSNKPIYLVSDTSLSLAAFTMSQEDFVAKVLMYGSANVAEEVCHINQWDQCSLPLNALDTALQLRQLDIVSFFLRNRETTSDTTSDNMNLTPPIPPDQLDAAVNLLTDVVKRNHNREHNSQFAGQLLRMTLNFLLRFIKTHSITGPSSKQSDSAQTTPISPVDITGHIHNLRQYLLNWNVFSQCNDQKSQEFVYLLQHMIQNESWQHLSTEEIVQSSLGSGYLPLAQAYFTMKSTEWVEPQDKEATGVHTPLDDVTYDELRRVGVGLVMKALSSKNLNQAMMYIHQMGGNVKESIRYIFYHTIQRQLRDALAELMSDKGWLTKNESDALECLHIIELYYPNVSYEDALLIYNETNNSSMPTYSPVNETDPLSVSKTGNILSYYPESFSGNHVVVWECVSRSSSVSPSTERQRGLYVQVPLYVILEWDSETRHRVLFDALVLSGASKDYSRCTTLVPPTEQLIYYLIHQNVDGSLPLVDEIAPTTVDELLTTAAHCNQYVRNVILDKLAIKYGFYLLPTSENLPGLLYRLGRLHNLFTISHPLSASDQSDDLVGKFHALFMSYLIKMEFFGLLYLYLDYYKLALDINSITKLNLTPTQVPDWVQLMIQCRLTAQNPQESERIFYTSLSAAKLLYNSSTITESLSNGHLLVSLATALYSPRPLTEAMNPANSREPWYIDANTLRQSLGAYPTLQAAIFPPHSAQLTPAQSQDMTVYELLKGVTQFDVTRLFKWQSTNKLAAANEEVEALIEVPHFSQPFLSQKYSQVDKLTYVYYLHQGQPSFALANFVAAKLLNKSNVTKRIDKVLNKIYKLVMSDFTNSCLTSSSVAFVEMLSRSSTHLRIDSQSALRIYKYLINKLEGEVGVVKDLDEQKKSIKTKITNQFIQLYESPDSHVSSSLLLQRLIQSTKHEIVSNGLKNCSIEAESYWLLVQQFCQCHSLPPTTEYLSECAKEGEWLPLLCHAQLYAIPAKEVLFVVEKHFSNPVVKEHLQLTISTIVTTPLPLSPTVSETSSTGSGRGKSRSRRKHMSGGTAKKEETRMSTTPLDVRAKFYSRVGLVNQKKNIKGPSDKAPPTSIKLTSVPMDSLGTNLASPIHTEVPLPPPISVKELPDDLFTVLFHCQDHTQPWKALLAYSTALQRPLLSLLAACYENSLILDCMSVWLCSTVGSKCLHKISEVLNISPTEDGDELHFSQSLQWKSWTERDLALVLLAAVLETPCPAGQFPLLFRYFDETNPLYHFLRFHEEFILRQDFKECSKQLQTFTLEMDKCVRLGRYTGRVGSSQWIEEIITVFTNHMIVTCPTPFERIQLLKLLTECDFCRFFDCQMLDFTQLYKISSILDKAGLSTVPAFKITDQFSPSQSAISLLEMYTVHVRVDGLNILTELVNKGQYNEAREYAQVAEISIAEVTLKEAESKYYKSVDTSYWQYQPARVKFWQQCHRSFVKDDVKPEAAVEFFESIVKTSTIISQNEKTFLLVLAFYWRKKLNSAEEEEDCIRNIWKSHLRALSYQLTSEIHQPTLPDMITDPSLSPVLNPRQQPTTAITPILSCLSLTSLTDWKDSMTVSQLVLPDNVPFVIEKQETNSSLLSREDSDILNIVIGRLLNAGWLAQARALAGLFKHDSPDLTIVLCCIQLAQGKLSPDHLTQDVLDLLANSQPRHHSGPSYTHDESKVKNKVSLEIIRMLQQLSDRCTHAHKCCQCIISCFKIAITLRKSYGAIVASDLFDTLAELLASLNTDKYVLAKLFVTSTNMQPKEVAGFLSECIASSLQSYIGGEEREYSRVKVYEPNMSTNNFMPLAQLCTDHALLGSHLLSMTKSLSSTEIPSESSLSVQVELLIRSHDCYTLACSVDGIAEVLKLSREITDSLYKGKHSKLMVRLLTGVGRFHEMTYIIQLLLECDEFESLVHLGVEKVEQLRVALMDYLRKHCKDDNEKRQMVALKFGMYRELAKTRESQAMKDMKKLRNKNLGSESAPILKRIFADLRDASKIYVKSNCLTRAEHCSSQAKLVALQLSLLQSGKQILNMDIKSVHKFMEEQPFTEALIVADAYKQTLLADWVNPLYRRVIIAGDTRYLNEFRSVFSLTPSIIQELASKYLLDKTRSHDSTQNMKKVLTYCTNLTIKHKLIQQLGFQDIVSTDSMMDEGFLRDLAKL